VFNYLAERDQLSPLDEAHEHQAASIVIPGRMETLHIGNKIIILDGAHNAQKIAALAESIRETYPKLSIATLTAFAETKDFKEPLETLAHLSQFVVLTSFSIFQGMARASAKPGELAHHFHSQNINHFEVIPDPQVAFSMLMNRHEDIILVTGSFFLLNHIRPLLYK
jgi:dihydrofolate synthase/folylpolyglutamate synthase